MPMLNFKQRFVEPIRAGRKTHTIRSDRKTPIIPGDRLFLFCGARTKSCFRILPEPVRCTRAERITIGKFGEVKIAGLFLDAAERQLLAFSDGFSDFRDMLDFWTGRLPFEGQIIHWKPPARPEAETQPREANGR